MSTPVAPSAATAERRQYEMVYILQTEMTDNEIEALTQRVTDTIFDGGGTNVSTELWGQRTLAYEIRKQWKGYYVLHTFEADAEAPAAIERLLRFNENVLRYKVMRTDN